MSYFGSAVFDATHFGSGYFSGGGVAVYRTPPELIRAAIIDYGIGADPNGSQVEGDWPVFVDHMPDAPDSAICVYHTTGLREGRIMRSGESVRKPGWQIRARGRNYTDVWTKTKQIQDFLDTIKRLSVVIEDQSFTIQSITQIGDALDFGQEVDADKRNNVTINGTITI